ncbi:DUF4386 domain-containing protein [Candidatus Saccharibacteria bacterium]|nr:DUF4386 domain-containing protein [Candidatus Saccharibacteria bacterium]
MKNLQSSDPTYRKTSLTAGLLYLLTFVSIPTLSLYSAAKGANYITSTGSDTAALTGALLEIVVALACIATAVVLYPILKKQSETLALGLLAVRVLEASAIFVGVACMLTIVGLHKEAVGPAGLITSQTLAMLYDKIFLVSQSFLPAVNDLLLGFLLYKSGLVPKALAMLGMVGALPLAIGFVAVLFGATEQGGSTAGLAAILVALFEFSLGLWLVVKGFNRDAVAKLSQS